MFSGGNGNRTRGDERGPGPRERPKDNLFLLLASSVSLGIEVQTGSGHPAAGGWGRSGRAAGSTFIQMVLKSGSFLLGPGASLRGVGQRPLHLCEPPLTLSSESSSPNYFGAKKNESAGHMAPRAFQVTETSIAVGQDIKTCPDQQDLCSCPVKALCHVVH